MYFVRFVLFCADAVNDFLRKNCPYVAGAISFYTLFSFFPLILAMITVAGFVSGPDLQETQLARDITQKIPVSTEFIGQTVEGVVSARAITGVASVFGLLWASTAAFGAMRKGINAAWGISKTRPFLKERLMDFTLVVGAGLLIMLMLFVTPILESFREATTVFAPEAEMPVNLVWTIIRQLVTLILSFLTFLILYRFLPNTEVRLSDAWLGALLAAAAFDGAMWGFVWYVTKFPVYNLVYGSVGAVMALLTWVYVSAIILLFGALVTSRYAAFAARVREEQGIRLLWAGLSRVRLRVVVTPGVA